MFPWNEFIHAGLYNVMNKNAKIVACNHKLDEAISF